MPLRFFGLVTGQTSLVQTLCSEAERLRKYTFCSLMESRILVSPCSILLNWLHFFFCKVCPSMLKTSSDLQSLEQSYSKYFTGNFFIAVNKLDFQKPFSCLLHDPEPGYVLSVHIIIWLQYFAHLQLYAFVKKNVILDDVNWIHTYHKIDFVWYQHHPHFLSSTLDASFYIL